MENVLVLQSIVAIVAVYLILFGLAGLVVAWG